MSRLGILLAAVMTLQAGAAAAAIPVKVQHLVRKTVAYEIDITYPQTGVAAIDREIAAWAKDQADNFVVYCRKNQVPGFSGMTGWGLQITYKVTRNDAQMFEAAFHREIGDDGNHTHFAFPTFNYMMPGAHRVFIEEVVAPAAYAKMRAYAVAHVVSEDPDYGAEIGEGSLPPDPDTFAAFSMSPTAITVWFTPEQLDNVTSAGGHAIIPLAELKGLVRPNWRAPQPSFDCKAARSAVEKTICSDVALSRLDRDMAAGYRWWLQLHLDTTGKWLAWEKANQRDWLAERQRKCTADTGMVACLTRLYQERIRVLHKQPG